MKYFIIAACFLPKYNPACSNRWAAIEEMVYFQSPFMGLVYDMCWKGENEKAS